MVGRYIVVFVVLAGCKVGDEPSSKESDQIAAESRDRRDTGDGDDIDVDDIDGARVERCERIGYPSVPWPSIGLFPFAVAAADISGDGNVDAVVANEGSDTVSVLLGNGNGTFRAKVD